MNDSLKDFVNLSKFFDWFCFRKDSKIIGNMIAPNISAFLICHIFIIN